MVKNQISPFRPQECPSESYFGISHGIMSPDQRAKFSPITKIKRIAFQGKIDKEHFLGHIYVMAIVHCTDAD